MKELANLVLSGLVTGAIYSVMASGLVLTYTTSGILNFAHGAIAFTTAYLYFQLHTALGLPIVPSLLISVLVFAPLLGLLLDVVLLRRLARAPVHARVVGTIGLLVMLPNLAKWLVETICIKVIGWDLPGNDGLSTGVRVPGIGPAPARSFQPLSGVVLNTDQLAVLIVAALSALGLWFVIRHTRLGLEMRAVVDRDSLAGLRGINGPRASALAWMMTMVLAGLGGVLIAPLFTLTDYVYTLVVLGSLAVAVLGGLRSIPIAFAGGLGLGVVQNLVAGYSDDVLPGFLAELSGLKASVPYLLMVVLLLLSGRDRSRLGGTVAEDVPRPDHRVGMSALRRRLPWAVATVLFVVYALQWSGVHWFRADTYGQTVIANGLALGVVFLSFVVVTGLGGMVSLAQASFVTAGGFGAGWLLSKRLGFDVPGIVSNGQFNFVWAVLLGAVAAGVVGMLIAVAVTRLNGVNVALGSLAFAFILSLVVFPLRAVRHSQSGWAIRPPTLDVPGLNWVHDQIVVGGHQPFFDAGQLPDQILLFLVVFGLITLAIHAFQRSASGRAILAVRSSEVAAAASGIRVVRTKILVFGFSAAIAGVGGVMLGMFNASISDTTASPLVGLSWLALVVTFGVRRPGGALIAGLLFTTGTAVFHQIGDLLPGGAVNDIVTSPYFVPMLSGLGAIQLAQEPDGVLALLGQKKLAKARARRSSEVGAGQPAGVTARTAAPAEAVAAMPVVAASVNGPEAGPYVLELCGVVGGYGDVEVVHGVSLALRAGTITALLGANGAGKSTLCGIAAGTVTSSAGVVMVGGTDVSSASPFRRARAGLMLVPEARGVFPGLSVAENIDLMLLADDERERAYERFPILRARRHQAAGLLSGGEQQMLGLVAALVHPPMILIADEPTLGLAPILAGGVMDAIVEIRSQGTAVLLVEEHAHNAFNVADHIAFMELGRMTWIGPKDEADLGALAGAYLGAQADDTAPESGPERATDCAVTATAQTKGRQWSGV